MEEASAMEKIDLLQYICFSFFSSKQESEQISPLNNWYSMFQPMNPDNLSNSKNLNIITCCSSLCDEIVEIKKLAIIIHNINHNSRLVWILIVIQLTALKSKGFKESYILRARRLISCFIDKTKNIEKAQLLTKDGVFWWPICS